MRREALAVSIPEGVRLTGLSRSYLYAAMTSGRLPFLKAGRRRLLLVEDITEFLARLRKAAVASEAVLPASSLSTDGKVEIAEIDNAAKDEPPT